MKARFRWCGNWRYRRSASRRIQWSSGGTQKMKIDKYSAILGNTVGFHDMDGLTEHRPIASLPFGGKYRLIDFPLSNLANAGIRSVFGNPKRKHQFCLRPSVQVEVGLVNTSHYYLGIYNTPVESSTVDKEYHSQIWLTLNVQVRPNGSALNSDVLVNIDLNQVFHSHTAGQNYCCLQNFPKNKSQM